MLIFAENKKYPSLQLLVHHDDAEREYKYDKGAGKVLEAARARDWNVIRMRNDWNCIFAFEKERAIELCASIERIY